jgi:tetratricopeptide (TPR) repeat protein
MRRVVLATLLFILPSFAQAQHGLRIEEVDALCQDLTHVQHLNHALDLCRRSLKRNPDQFEIQVRASRLCWYIGVQLESEEKAKEMFEIGYELAEKMRQRHPDKPDGWYWYAVNYGQHINRSSIFAKIAGAGRIMEYARKTLELAPDYDFGGAYLMVGRINQIIPGGDDRMAEEYFLKAVKIAPKRSTGHLYLGELYHDRRKHEEARREIKMVLEGPPDPRFAVERVLDTPRAKELIVEIESELADR